MRSLAFLASRARTAGSRIRCKIRLTNSEILPEAKRRPVSPSLMSSGVPPTFEATIAHFDAMASMSELESASVEEGKTKISI
jgi:hypothetical protein